MVSFLKGLFFVAGTLTTILSSVFKDNTLATIAAVFVSTFAIMEYIDRKFRELNKGNTKAE